MSPVLFALLYIRAQTNQQRLARERKMPLLFLIQPDQKKKKNVNINVRSVFLRVALDYAPPNTCYFMIIIASVSLLLIARTVVVLFIGCMCARVFILRVASVAVLR